MKKKLFFKWLKRITLVLGIIPILLFLAFAGAVSFIDFNQYKSQIEQEVSSYTNREFKIEGEVDVSVFPFAFTLGESYLKNPEGFGSERLLSIKETQIELSLSALLLNKAIKVTSLELLEPKLHLIKTEFGDNWSDIKGLAEVFIANKTPMFAKPQTATEWFESLEKIQVSLNEEIGGGEKIEEPSQEAAPWRLNSLVVHNGLFQFYDKTNGFAETIVNVNILAFDVRQGQPFDVSSEFIYQSSLSERMYDVTLNGKLKMDSAFKIWQLSQWHGIFKIRLPEDKKIPEIRLTTQGERFELALDSLNISVEKAIFNGLDGQLETSFSGNLGVTSSLAGTANIQRLKFKEWAKHLGVPLPKFVDQKALSEGNGQFDWHWDGDLLLLNKLDLKIDESHITGALSYELQGDQSLNFDLNIDRLNLDLYRAYITSEPPTFQSSIEGGRNLEFTPVRVSEAEVASETLVSIPLSMFFLQQLNATGALNLTNVNAFGVQIEALEMALLAKQGVLELAPLDARLYQGELLSRLTIDLAGEQPAYHWKGRVNQLDLSKIKVFPVLAGVMVSRFDLKTKGDQVAELKSHLTGKWSLNVTDAQVDGLDVNALLEGELNLQPSYTEVQKVRVLGRWLDGVYSARKLDVRSERFSITGAASFDLNTAHIDSGLILFVDRPIGGGEILKGVTIPMTYKGILGAENTSDQAVWTMNLVTLSLGTKEQRALLEQVGNLFRGPLNNAS